MILGYVGVKGGYQPFGFLSGKKGDHIYHCSGTPPHPPFHMREPEIVGIEKGYCSVNDCLPGGKGKAVELEEGLMRE